MEAESKFFDTDFGVKFGHLICFDILFAEPAAGLLRQGVRNFVYPSKWVSELPFLTAIQTQQSWAYAHNVNLLAAGISDPEKGSTGSGIYSGEQGTLQSHFGGDRVDVALKYKITKEPGQNVLAALDLPTASPKVMMLRDFVDNYTITKIAVSAAENTTTLCHGEFCCEFNYHLVDVGRTDNTVRVI